MLSEDRPERAAGHDDRALSAERATGTDTDRRRNRLEHSNFGLDPTAFGEDGLNRFWHAVTADLVRAETGHHPDHQTPGDRRAQNQPPRMVLRTGRHQAVSPPLVEDKIGH
jgi:hypothetical protein